MTLLGNVWAILQPDERRRSVLILILLLAATAVEMVSVGLVVPVLAFLTMNTEWLPPALRDRIGWFGDPGSFRAVLLLLLGLVGVFAVKSLFLLFVAACQARHVRAVQANVSQRLFATMLGQPWPFHLQRNSASIVHVVEETQAFAQACMHLLQIGAELLVGTGLLLLLLWIEPVGAAIVAGLLGAAIWLLTRVVRARSRRWAEARHHHARMLRQQVQEGLGGVKEVKVHGCEREFVQEFRRHSDANARVMTLQWIVEQMPRPWFELLSVAALFLLAAAMAWDGKPVRVLIPVLGLYATVAFRMLPSINHATIAAQRLRHAEPMIASLRQHLALERSLPAPGPVVLKTFRREIRFENVSYRYPGGDQDVLSDVDLTIPHGMSVGFIGSSGAGKSTLVDVLLGLLPPTRGRVSVDGFDIHDNVRGWQHALGYVPQSIYLVDGTIRRNVAFGVPERLIDDDAVHRALAAAQLDDFIRSLPDGIETVVGERGVRLSGGQRQRLAIARALYIDPDVLVLDEATSALDVDTEREIMAAVDALHGTKTLIIVAHRLTTLAGCDVLHRLDGGRIVRSGSYAELVPTDPARSPAG